MLTNVSAARLDALSGANAMSSTRCPAGQRTNARGESQYAVRGAGSNPASRSAASVPS